MDVGSAPGDGVAGAGLLQLGGLGQADLAERRQGRLHQAAPPPLAAQGRDQAARARLGLAQRGVQRLGLPDQPRDPTQKDGPRQEQQGFLFAVPGPLDDLEEMLLTEFAGRELTVREVFDEHNVGKRYTERNYKDALKKLIAAGTVSTIIPPGKKLIAGRLPDWCIVKFPVRGT
jgi:hypothetical protein